MKSKPVPLLAAIAWLAGAMVSCTESAVGDIRVTEVAPGDWGPQTPAEVVYDNVDTLRHRNLSVLIRLRNDFPYDRLDFVVETLTPDSLLWRDTLSLRPEPVEAASLTYTDVKTAYRSGTILEHAGAYRFRFTPSMPETTVKEVIGVGVVVSD
jgi:gliding motility-associated lipoprotein GldH